MGKDSGRNESVERTDASWYQYVFVESYVHCKIKTTMTLEYDFYFECQLIDCNDQVISFCRMHIYITYVYVSITIDN